MYTYCSQIHMWYIYFIFPPYSLVNLKTMKKFIFLLLIIYQTSSFSQPEGIINIIVSPIDESTINVKSIVHFLNIAEYVDHEIDIENNTIELNLCYQISVFPLEDNVWHDNIINVTGLTGEYTLNINIFEDSEGCFINILDTDSLTFPIPLEGEVTLSNPIFQENNVSIYPNPTKDLIYIESNNTINAVKIFDTLVRLVLEQNNPSNQIDVSNLSSGLLFVQIEIDNGSLSKKVIKD